MNENIIQEQENTEGYEEEITMDMQSEQILGHLRVEQEMKRMDIEENPTSKIPDSLKKDDLFKELSGQAYILGECFQILMGYGIDYANSVNLSSIILQNKINVDTAKIQQIQIQQQQL